MARVLYEIAHPPMPPTAADGPRARGIYKAFNMEAGAKAFSAMAADPDGVKLRAESENDPASVWEGPEVWRTVFGEPRPDFPVMLQREYQMDRRNLKRAVELLPEVQALRPDRPVIAVIPVVSSDMARLTRPSAMNGAATTAFISRRGQAGAHRRVAVLGPHARRNFFAGLPTPHGERESRVGQDPADRRQLDLARRA